MALLRLRHRKGGSPLPMQVEHQVARSVASTFSQGLRDAIAEGQAAVPLADLQEAWHLGDIHMLLNRIPWDSIFAAMRERFKAAYLKAIHDAAVLHRGLLPASRIVRKAPDELETLLAFDLHNPQAIHWAELQSATAVTSIDEFTRQAIRQVITRMFVDGIPVREAAQEIRSLIGLTPRYAMAAYNYRRGLEQDQDREPDQVERMAIRYSQRLLNLRAETIARTESIAASAEGQQSLWETARDKGLLDTDHTQRKWLVSPDERTCEICLSIEANGPVGLDEDFQSDDGPVSQPPAHPACRCAVRLVFTD